MGGEGNLERVQTQDNTVLKTMNNVRTDQEARIVQAILQYLKNNLVAS